MTKFGHPYHLWIGICLQATYTTLEDQLSLAFKAQWDAGTQITVPQLCNHLQLPNFDQQPRSTGEKPAWSKCDISRCWPYRPNRTLSLIRAKGIVGNGFPHSWWSIGRYCHSPTMIMKIVLLKMNLPLKVLSLFISMPKSLPRTFIINFQQSNA